MFDLKARMFNRKAARTSSMWQEIIRSLAPEKGKKIADIGSGGGYFSLRFSREVENEGKVYAVDTNSGFLNFLKNISNKEGIHNIETVLAEQGRLPFINEELDMVFLRNVYHHIPDRVDYFRNLFKYLKKDGKIAIIDYDGKRWFSFHHFFGHYVPEKTIKEEMKDAGYRLIEEYSFLPEQSFLVFSNPK